MKVSKKAKSIAGISPLLKVDSTALFFNAAAEYPLRPVLITHCSPSGVVASDTITGEVYLISANMSALCLMPTASDTFLGVGERIIDTCVKVMGNYGTEHAESRIREILHNLREEDQAAEEEFPIDLGDDVEGLPASTAEGDLPTPVSANTTYLSTLTLRLTQHSTKGPPQINDSVTYFPARRGATLQKLRMIHTTSGAPKYRGFLGKVVGTRNGRIKIAFPARMGGFAIVTTDWDPSKLIVVTALPVWAVDRLATHSIYL